MSRLTPFVIASLQCRGPVGAWSQPSGRFAGLQVVPNHRSGPFGTVSVAFTGFNFPRSCNRSAQKKIRTGFFPPERGGGGKGKNSARARKREWRGPAGREWCRKTGLETGTELPTTPLKKNVRGLPFRHSAAKDRRGPTETTARALILAGPVQPVCPLGSGAVGGLLFERRGGVPGSGERRGDRGGIAGFEDGGLCFL